MKKRIVSIILAVIMIVGMLPLSAIPAFAEEAVTEYYALDVDDGAYIDTGFFPDSYTRVVMDAVVTMDASWANLFGVYRKDSYFYVNNALGDFGAGFGSKVDWVTPFAFARRKIELDRNVFKLDGETKYTFAGADFTCSDVMYLFALNHYGNIQFQGGQHIRFYSCQIYSKWGLEFDFVPAGKGGRYGLYDKESGNFYEFKFYEGKGSVSPVNGPDGKTALPTTPGSTLTSGTYVVSQDTTIEAASCQSALVVNGFVTIIIEKGVTLTVKGGNANGTTGAGAGIEVPDGCALTIAGGGTLNATGGDADVGGIGGTGGDAKVYDDDDPDNPYDEDWCITGAGGDGGDGGGGAGAGIGGKGGNGGKGGAGGSLRSVEATPSAQGDGYAGESGKAGTAGESCGNVSIYDSVTRNITGGNASQTASIGGYFGWKAFHEWTNYYIAFGGGAGGGGGNGYPAAAIGSGGAGGGGGGGGGSGLIVYWHATSDFLQVDGSGCGGYGGVGYGGGGAKGADKPSTHTDDTSPGAGGFGGAAGGGAGTEKANIIPTVQIPTPNTIVYNGKEQEGVTFPFGNITGNKATNAGEYTAFLTPYDGYYWKDGSTGEKTVKWSIAKRPVSPPAEACCYYTGNEITFFTETDLYTVENGSATGKGEHTATIKLKYPNNYKWENSDDECVFVNYYIHKFEDESGKCPICGKIFGKYISGSWNGTTKKLDKTENDIPEDVTEITSKTTELKGGWYVLASDVEFGSRITVTGTPDNPTNIILMNGYTLNAKNGISVAEGNVLNIYGQKGNSGKIVATGSMLVAGIGGGEEGNGGTVTVYGGTVNATGGENSAGIGGGWHGDGGTVTVYGGIVNATGDPLCAGIGGGYKGDGGTVTIYGGTVTATVGRSYSYFGEQAIGRGGEASLSGNFDLDDSAFVKAGPNKDNAYDTSYTGQPYVQIHFHNAETCRSISGTQHKCSVCGETENHTDKTGDSKCDVCGEPFAQIGDGNGDGKIDAEDLIVLRRALLTDAKYTEVLDCNGDGVLDIRDLVRMKKHIASGTPLGKIESNS